MLLKVAMYLDKAERVEFYHSKEWTDLRQQALARDKGAVGVYFSAPEGARLSMLFERLFQPKDRVYWAKSKE